MKTLNELKDYFSTTNNTYIQNKLQLLEIEIEETILKTKIDTIDTFIIKLNNK